MYLYCKKHNLDYISATRARNATWFLSLWLAWKK
jgi:hypothetical protein